MRLRSRPRVSPLEYRVQSRRSVLRSRSALLSTRGGVLAAGVPTAYYGGLMVVLVLYAVAIGEHWKRAALSAAGIVLAYPASVFGVAMFTPARGGAASRYGVWARSSAAT